VPRKTGTSAAALVPCIFEYYDPAGSRRQANLREAAKRHDWICQVRILKKPGFSVINQD
jgi:hypothetical protein